MAAAAEVGDPGAAEAAGAAEALGAVAMDDAILTGVSVGAVLAVAAYCLAILELEIEGRHGWALRLPTWRRQCGLLGSGTTPVTGYHVALFFAYLLAMLSGQALNVLEGGSYRFTSAPRTFGAMLLLFTSEDLAWWSISPYKPKNHFGDKLTWALRFAPSCAAGVGLVLVAAVADWVVGEDNAGAQTLDAAFVSGLGHATGIAIAVLLSVPGNLFVGAPLYAHVRQVLDPTQEPWKDLSAAGDRPPQPHSKRESAVEADDDEDRDQDHDQDHDADDEEEGAAANGAAKAHQRQPPAKPPPPPLESVVPITPTATTPQTPETLKEQIAAAQRAAAAHNGTGAGGSRNRLFSLPTHAFTHARSLDATRSWRNAEVAAATMAHSRR